VNVRVPERQECSAIHVRGLSLVELLVSLLLGLLLSTGLVSAYLGAKRNVFYDEQLARMQENGRYAMRLLSRDLAMAGFFAGVPSMSAVEPGSVGTDCSNEDWVLDGREPLELVNDFAGDSPPVSRQLTPFTCLQGSMIVSGTDLIAIKRTAAQPSLHNGVPAATLTSATTESWFLRTVLGSPDAWEKLRPVDLRDPIRAQPEHSYWEAITRIFYIRSYSEPGSEDEDLPTLCMETLAGDGMTSRCLVEGVENLQLEFGVDSDGDGVPNRYLLDPGASDMPRVVAVKIHLLLRSIVGVTGHRDDKTFRLGQMELSARGDSYLRRVFSSTVLLRNRNHPVG
jgi:type IV pilus assembly protein PilW